MNSALTLVQQPTPVLAALFNRIVYKKNPDGSIKPVCIQICEILNKRGYDMKKLNYDDYLPDEFIVTKKNVQKIIK